MTASEHYNAFISYRHNPRDASVAKAIQNGLEHFVIPPSVKKQTGKRRIDRVFRDKEELPLTRDLGENIDRALANSEFLIVICSPELQESRWCMREIEVFLASHSKDQVLTVVTEGEPSDVIPPVLLEETVTKTDPETGSVHTENILVEPLSCDFRKPASTGSHKDFREAQRSELPRLAAVLLGCTYDELIRRRHQYQMHKFLLGGLTALGIAAVAIGYLVWSRNEIQSNYNNALISQSRELAVKSKDALNDEDRVNAVRLAMEALPSTDLDRPVTAEAEYALTEALGVYTSGQFLKGTWIFEARDRIHSFAYSLDGSYLLAMDRSGALTVWDIATRERIVIWEINRDEDIPSFTVLPDNRALVWRGNMVFVMDYLTGNQIWLQNLRYSGISASLSPSGDSVFIENRKDLYQIDIKTGEIQYSLKDDTVPENRYYYGIRCAPDGHAAFVQSRFIGDGDESCFCIWNPNDNTLETLCHDQKWHNVSQFGWSDNASVFICHQEGGNTSYSGGNIISIADDPLTVSLIPIASDTPLWETSLIFSSVNTQTLTSPSSYISENGETRTGLLLAYGQTVVTLDLENGETALRRDLGETVLGFLEITADHYLAALRSGQVALVNYQPRTIIYYKQFASGIDSVIISPAATFQNHEAIVMRDGKALLYEFSGSSTYTACSGETGVQPRESEIYEGVSGRYLITLTEEPSLLITDTSSMHTDSYSLPGASYDWKLFAESSTSGNDHVILACNDDQLRFYCFDPMNKTLSPLSTDVPMQIDYGLFFASYGHLFSQQNHYIYFSNADHEIRRLDTSTGDITSIELSALRKSQHLQNAYRKDLLSYGSLTMPAPVFVSNQGQFALATIYDDETDTSSSVIVNLTNGNTVFPEMRLYDGLLSAAFDEAQEKVAVSGNFLINIYDMQGNTVAQVSHAGRQLLSLSWHNAELLALYSDKVLERYNENGEMLSSTQLVFSDTPMGIYENIRWKYTADRLYLQIDSDLCIVNISEWPVHQNAAVADTLIWSDDGIWNYSIEPGSDLSAAYRIGKFTELDMDTLMEMGRRIAQN